MATNETKIRITAEDKASRVVGNVKRELLGLSSVGSRLAGVVSPLGAISLAAAALGGAVLGVKNFANQIDDLAATAEGLGVSAVALAEMRSKASESAVGANELDRALAKLNERLIAAKSGSKEAAAAFEAIGIDPSKVRSTQQGLELIADKMATYANTAEKGAYLSKLFGERIGPKLAEYLSQGSGALRQFTGLTDKSVEEARQLQGQLNTLSNNFEKLANTILGLVVPAVNAFFNAFSNEDLRSKINGLNAEIARAERALNRAANLQPRDFEKRQKELSDLLIERARLMRQLDQEGIGSQAKRIAPKVPELGGKESDAERFLKSLKEQAAAAGKTAEEVLRIKAANFGLADTAEPYIRAIEKVKEDAEQLKNTIEFLTEQERRRLEIDTQITAAYMAQENAADAIVGSVLTGVERLQLELKKLDELERSGAIARAAVRFGVPETEIRMRVIKKLMEETNEVVKEQKSLAEELGLTFSSAFEDAIVKGGDLRDVLKGIEQDILRIVTRSLVTEPLGKSLTGLLGRGIPNLAGLFGGGGVDLVGAGGGAGNFNWGGGFASGGYVQPGTWGLVGERGPEMIYAGKTGATVVDADRTKRAGRQITVNVNVPPNTSGSSASQIGAAAARALAIADARFN